MKWSPLWNRRSCVSSKVIIVVLYFLSWVQTNQLQVDFSWNRASTPCAIPAMSFFGTGRLDLPQIDGLRSRSPDAGCVNLPEAGTPSYHVSCLNPKPLAQRQGLYSSETNSSVSSEKIKKLASGSALASGARATVNRTRRSNICIFEGGCRRRAVFGDASGATPRRAVFCAAHRRPTDLDVANRACDSPAGCLRPAYFGVAGGGPQRFCLTHRLPSHVNMR